MLTDGVADDLPKFVTPIENVTVSVGREARLACVVENLHNYRVAWIYKGTGGRTVLTMAMQVVTKNPKISTTQEAQAWVLTITNLTKKDQGIYMCQLNTKPARKQMGYLHVVEPPVIDDAASSSDSTVDEGSDVFMTCDAHGDPHPIIRWVREDGLRFNLNSTLSVDEYLGRSLTLQSVDRNATGAFLCIASNGVPPTMSKRILLSVKFPPKIVKDGGSGRIGVAMEGVARMICRFHAYPLTEVLWYRGPREVKAHKPAVTMDTTHDQGSGLWKSVLSVQIQRARDFGQYRCFVRNPLGVDELTFDLIEITTTTTTTSTTTTTTTTTAPSQLLAPKASTHRPAHQESSQPPFVPWRGFSAIETTTSASQNRFIQEGEAEGSRAAADTHKNQQQTSLGFGSYFDNPTSSSSSIWSSSSSWLRATCTGISVFLVLLFLAMS
ncbi:protein amalgam-like [Homarus americanus]|uniref:protein amalgam-like n=1 Tax=Homarus americanus TaxID=6706 RepID=UPI001C4410C8|nr:protein amalgam-like [Homarus americanus]